MNFDDNFDDIADELWDYSNEQIQEDEKNSIDHEQIQKKQSQTQSQNNTTHSSQPNQQNTTQITNKRSLYKRKAHTQHTQNSQAEIKQQTQTQSSQSSQNSHDSFNLISQSMLDNIDNMFGSLNSQSQEFIGDFEDVKKYIDVEDESFDKYNQFNLQQEEEKLVYSKLRNSQNKTSQSQLSVASTDFDSFDLDLPSLSALDDIFDESDEEIGDVIENPDPHNYDNPDNPEFLNQTGLNDYQDYIPEAFELDSPEAQEFLDQYYRKYKSIQEKGATHEVKYSENPIFRTNSRFPDQWHPKPFSKYSLYDLRPSVEIGPQPRLVNSKDSLYKWTLTPSRILKSYPDDSKGISISSKGRRGYLQIDELYHDRRTDENKTWGDNKQLCKMTLKEMETANFKQMDDNAKCDNAIKYLSKQRQERLNMKLEYASSAEEAKKIVQKHSQLLVDQYAPKNYMDLLSNERHNRQSLWWILEWRRYIDYLHTQAIIDADNKTNSNTAQKNVILNPVSAPMFPILMLAGPPGTGKTTLATIIAKHCNFNIMHINASDNRSGDSLKTQIINALENKTLKDGIRSNVEVNQENNSGKGVNNVVSDNKNFKPNNKMGDTGSCLILDEIDGVSGEEGGIGILVDLCKNISIYKYNLMKQLNAGGDDLVEEEGGSSKLKGKLIKRPIICICNDITSPSLRSLLQYCKVINMKGIEAPKLASRLKLISKQEGLHLDSKVAMQLAKWSEGDIRWCLNNIEYFRITNNKLTSLSEISGKDTNISFQHISNIITRKTHIKNSLGKIVSGDDEKKEILMELEKSEEVVDQVLDYVSDNYLHSNMDLLSSNHCSGMLSDYYMYGRRAGPGDEVHGGAGRYMFFYLYLYSLIHPKHSTSILHANNQKATNTSKSLVTTNKNLPPITRYLHYNANTLSKQLIRVSEFARVILPNLLPILTLPFGIENPQLLREQEKQRLEETIQIFTDLGLTFSRSTIYVPNTNQNYSSSYYRNNRNNSLVPHTARFLSPNIEHLMIHKPTPSFSDFPCSSLYSERSKEEIAYQVKTSLIRAEAVVGNTSKSRTDDNSLVSQSDISTQTNETFTQPPLPIFEQKPQQPPPIVTPEIVSPKTKRMSIRDMMMQKSKSKPKPKPTNDLPINLPGVMGIEEYMSQTQSQSQPPLRQNVPESRANNALHFSFVEGFSNAVRKPIPMSFFLDLVKK